ncbi:hypothetical protein [Aquabacterium sp.]|uniref:hypothetical protein n=1 Tax=Aquabacterium sp. TaxID=1872578 RepID=UPI0035AE3F8C
MKKQVLAILVASALGVLTTSSANAQLGKMMGGLGGSSNSSSTTASADPQEFIKSAQSAEKLMNNSLALLAVSLSSKEKAAELEAQRKAANAVTDSAEKQAKMTELHKSEAAAVNEAMNNSNTDANIKKMGGQQRDTLAASAYNFMLALLKDKALLEQGQGLVSSLSSNPMNMSKVSGVKDSMSSLTNQVSTASSIAGKMPAIFTAVGVKAPASKDEKPKQVAQVDGE